MKFAILIAAVAASACGDNVAIDAPDENSDIPITFTVKDPPLLVAYRGATQSEWKHAEMVNPTTFQIFAGGPYLLTVICREPDHVIWVQQIAQTPGDPEIPVWCERSKGPNRLMIRLNESQSMNIWVHSQVDFQEGAYGVWSLPAGTYDAIAGDDKRIAIRRRIRVERDTTINNPFDLAVEGVSLVPAMFTVANPLPPERYGASVTLYTQFGSYYAGRMELDKALVVPDSVLEPADIQYVRVGAGSRLGSRAVRRKFREGDSTTFTLPERMGPVTFAQTGNTVAAIWSTLPEHDRILHSANGLSSMNPSLFVIYEATVSRSFEVDTGITDVTFDTAIPGYQPEWHIDFSKEYSQWLEVEHQVGSDTFISSRWIDVNVPPVEGGGGLLDHRSRFLAARHRDLP